MLPLVTLLTLQAGVVDPAKDPAYAKPITVELALQPIKKVVAAIAGATGKPVDASGTITDLKATMMVKNLPAGRAMEALSDALDLVWRDDAGTLRLVRPEGQIAQIEAYKRAELTEAQRTGGAFVPRPTAGYEGPGPGTFGRGRRFNAPEAVAGRTGAVRFNPYLLAMEAGGGKPASRLLPATPTGETPFAKAAQAWPSLPATPDPAWERPVGNVAPKTAWEGNEVTLADLLAAWHASSGLPVVADAFRVPLKSTSIAPASALAGLQAVAARDGFALKLSDGVARLRHPGFWRLRDQEIAEANWSDLEHSRPNLGGLASFAARLNPAQAASFHSEEAPVSKVSTAAIREAYPALLLLNTLSGDAQNALFAGRPVALAQVPGSRDAYAYALREAPFWDAGDPAEMLRTNPAKVGLFGQSADKAFQLRLAGAQGGGVTYTIPLEP